MKPWRKIALAFVLAVFGCAPRPAADAPTAPAAEPLQVPLPEELPSNDEPVAEVPEADASTTVRQDGLRIEELRAGDGEAVQADHTVTMHYVGTLTDGTVFDSSRDRGRPFTASLKHLIPGFADGVLGMRVGGMRRITIPSELGYRDTERPKIPAGSTLIFEVELLEVK